MDSIEFDFFHRDFNAPNRDDILFVYIVSSAAIERFT